MWVPDDGLLVRISCGVWTEIEQSVTRLATRLNGVTASTSHNMHCNWFLYPEFKVKFGFVNLSMMIIPTNMKWAVFYFPIL